MKRSPHNWTHCYSYAECIAALSVNHFSNRRIFTNTDESLNQPSRIQIICVLLYKRKKNTNEWESSIAMYNVHMRWTCYMYTSTLLAHSSQNWSLTQYQLYKWEYPVNVWCAEAENYFMILYLYFGRLFCNRFWHNQNIWYLCI